jgi:hypothetical protein
MIQRHAPAFGVISATLRSFTRPGVRKGGRPPPFFYSLSAALLTRMECVLQGLPFSRRRDDGVHPLLARPARFFSSASVEPRLGNAAFPSVVPAFVTILQRCRFVHLAPLFSSPHPGDRATPSRLAPSHPLPIGRTLVPRPLAGMDRTLPRPFSTTFKPRNRYDRDPDPSQPR